MFVFRGKNAWLLKILFWDVTGLCLFTKRMNHGQFMWPSWRLGDAVAGTAVGLAERLQCLGVEAGHPGEV
ncbi:MULTISPECIES: IS66 family insertion sequence element accessory protein TnpB [unclassified Mesorhizobium]|uniref:IS66 family insertion sequence element accessory protein TnpB n=1 Tax=Mesorhizobium sp. B3-1-3 TaxID=2589896 RepID=UPI001FED512D|nr:MULTISPECIES: IS66 family insertion sequence element accessory protein TnpB [unclassified Mesorhizobium]